MLDRIRVTKYETIVCKMSHKEYAAMTKPKQIEAVVSKKAESKNQKPIPKNLQKSDKQMTF